MYLLFPGLNTIRKVLQLFSVGFDALAPPQFGSEWLHQVRGSQHSGVLPAGDPLSSTPCYLCVSTVASYSCLAYLETFQVLAYTFPVTQGFLSLSVELAELLPFLLYGSFILPLSGDSGGIAYYSVL